MSEFVCVSDCRYLIDVDGVEPHDAIDCKYITNASLELFQLFDLKGKRCPVIVQQHTLILLALLSLCSLVCVIASWISSC